MTHTDNGKHIFKNFLFLICKLKRKWSIPSQKNRLIQEIRSKVKKGKVGPKKKTQIPKKIREVLDALKRIEISPPLEISGGLILDIRNVPNCVS